MVSLQTEESPQIEELLLASKDKNRSNPSRFLQWYSAVSTNPISADVYFIAEIGLNHDGDLDKAKATIQAAKRAGADGVKFQTFTAEELVHPEVDYMSGAFEIFRSTELSFSQFRELREEATLQGLDFLSTPFSPRAVHFLADLDVPAFKVASGDINNFLMLAPMARYQKPIILSTGASDMDEVDKAIAFLRKNGAHNLIVLHCLSEYPAALSRVGWYTIPYLVEQLGLPVGFSDHTQGVAGPVMAFAMGARIIEKHFTLDKGSGGADHLFSADEAEFKSMVDSIRELGKGLGFFSKEPTSQEKEGNSVGRRGIYFARELREGSVLREEDLVALRPQNGFSPSDVFSIVGKKLAQAVTRLEPVSWEDFR